MNAQEKLFVWIFLLLLALAWALSAQAPTPAFDLVITNGHIIDGTGSPVVFRRPRHPRRKGRRHYFVMEYVPGVPITDYCDQKRLKTRERLELFVKVREESPTRIRYCKNHQGTWRVGSLGLRQWPSH